MNFVYLPKAGIPMVAALIGYLAYGGDLMRLQMSCWILINSSDIIVISF